MPKLRVLLSKKKIFGATVQMSLLNKYYVYTVNKRRSFLVAAQCRPS